MENKYQSAIRFLALSQSDFGSFIRDKYPNLIDIAKKIVDDYKPKTENTEAKSLSTQILEINNYLQDLNPSDHDARKELTVELETLARQFKEESEYDWTMYYFKYLYNLSSHQGDEVNLDPMKNEAFVSWFLGSKVVDKNGKPMLVYHGTGVEGDEFDRFKFNLFPAAYFAEEKTYAEWFAAQKGAKGASLLYKCYLRIVNPLDLSEFGTDSISYDELVLYIKLKYGYDMPENKMLRAMSERWGNDKWIWRYFRSAPNWLTYIRDMKEFDGICFYENNPQDLINGKENVTKAWVALFDYQIKSADLRNTTYSLESGKITMKRGGVLC